MALASTSLFIAQSGAVQAWDVSNPDAPFFVTSDSPGGLPQRIAVGSFNDMWVTLRSPAALVRYDATGFPNGSIFRLQGTEPAAGVAVDGQRVIVGRPNGGASAIEVYQFDGTALRLLDRLAVARAPEHLTVFQANAGRLVLSGVTLAGGGGGGAAYNFEGCALP
jgi:hypothetical protein